MPARDTTTFYDSNFIADIYFSETTSVPIRPPILFFFSFFLFLLFSRKINPSRTRLAEKYIMQITNTLCVAVERSKSDNVNAMSYDSYTFFPPLSRYIYIYITFLYQIFFYRNNLSVNKIFVIQYLYYL